VSDDRVRVGYLLTAALAVLYNGQDLKEIELAALNRLLRKLETTGEDQTTERERDFLKRLGRIELC